MVDSFEDGAKGLVGSVRPSKALKEGPRREAEGCIRSI